MDDTAAEPFWLDVPLTFASLKKARSKAMSFAVLPPKKAADPPWLIVGKASEVKTRVRQARKVAKKSFKISELARGQLEIHANRLIFVVDEGPVFADDLIRWSQKLKSTAPADPIGEDAIEVATEAKKVAVLLKKGRVFTAEEAVARPWEGLTAESWSTELNDGTNDIGDEDLKEIFGDDYAEIAATAVAQALRLAKVMLSQPVPVVAFDHGAAREQAPSILAKLGGRNGLQESVALIKGNKKLLASILDRCASPPATTELGRLVIDAMAKLKQCELLHDLWELKISYLEEAQEGVKDGVEALDALALVDEQQDALRATALREVERTYETREWPEETEEDDQEKWLSQERMKAKAPFNKAAVVRRVERESLEAELERDTRNHARFKVECTELSLQARNSVHAAVEAMKAAATQAQA